MSVRAVGRDGAIAALRAQAEAMYGSETLPRTDGDVVLDEPWQGRAVALALETVHSLQLPWEDFRRELIAAIAQDPHRPYFTSWLLALERLVIRQGGALSEDLMTHRMRAASYRTDEAGHDDLEVFPIAVDGPTLRELLDELNLPHRPDLTMLDGCLNAHAELQRLWIDGAPRRWMFRMYDGEGAQVLTIVLPNPFLDDDERVLDEPDWARLLLWDRLRERFLGLPPDPVDRSGGGTGPS